MSDAFMTNAVECGKISLEVVVKFINVNYEKSAELLTKCKTMQGYSVLIYKIREKQKAHGNLAAAIEESIRECEAVREADGYASGYEQGEAAGYEAGKLEVAANLKKAGLDIDIIAANTGLTKEEIEKL